MRVALITKTTEITKTTKPRKWRKPRDARVQTLQRGSEVTERGGTVLRTFRHFWAPFPMRNLTVKSLKTLWKSLLNPLRTFRYHSTCLREPRVPQTTGSPAKSKWAPTGPKRALSGQWLGGAKELVPIGPEKTLNQPRKGSIFQGGFRPNFLWKFGT